MNIQTVLRSILSFIIVLFKSIIIFTRILCKPKARHIKVSMQEKENLCLIISCVVFTNERLCSFRAVKKKPIMSEPSGVIPSVPTDETVDRDASTDLESSGKQMSKSKISQKKCTSLYDSRPKGVIGWPYKCLNFRSSRR